MVKSYQSHKIGQVDNPMNQSHRRGEDNNSDIKKVLNFSKFIQIVLDYDSKRASESQNRECL